MTKAPCAALQLKEGYLKARSDLIELSEKAYRNNALLKATAKESLELQREWKSCLSESKGSLTKKVKDAIAKSEDASSLKRALEKVSEENKKNQLLAALDLYELRKKTAHECRQARKQVAQEKLKAAAHKLLETEEAKKFLSELNRLQEVSAKTVGETLFPVILGAGLNNLEPEICTTYSNLELPPPHASEALPEPLDSSLIQRIKAKEKTSKNMNEDQ